MKVCAVTTWPPYKDGVALYSAELYGQITKLVNLCILSNISQQNKTKSIPQIVLRSWKRRPWYFLTVFHGTLKTRCNLVHLQHGWLLYGGFVSSLMFPVLLALFRLSHKPCVVTMHSVIRKDAQFYSNFLVNCFARIAILWITHGIALFSSQIIVHNSLMKQTLQNSYNTKPEKITIIPHGVKKSTRPTKVSKTQKQITVLSLGFIRKGKNIECLLGAFETFLETFPDSKLVIVGGSHAHDDPRYVKTFKTNLLPRLQQNVFFAGFVESNLLEQFITESDIIVLQSGEPNYVEASGTVAAVADYAKPLICSKVPKFQYDLQNEKDCILVNPSNSAELAQALVLLVKSSELRSRLGKNLRDKHKHNYWDIVAKEHVSVYKRLLINRFEERNH